MSVFDRFKFWKREYEKTDADRQAKGAAMAATIQLDDPTRKKIERRARRAFEDLDAGASRRHHRITDVTKTGLLYRLRHKPGESMRCGKKIYVARRDDGEVEITITRPSLPSTADLDLRTKDDLQKIASVKRVRGYKVTTKEGKGPHYPSLQYEVGKDMEVTDFNTDPGVDCGKGINLGSLDWVKSEHKSDYRLFAVEFDSADLVAIPARSSGKFRVKRCTVVEELDPATAW